MDYYNLSTKRESTRSFKKRPVSGSQLEELKAYIPLCDKLLPNLEVSIQILGEDAFQTLGDSAGYHGFMIEAPNYLVISSAPEENYLENAGYIGEDLVLKMTELEIESCWITIREPEKAAKALGLPAGQVPAALIAFGNATVSLPSSRLDIKSFSDVLSKKRTGFVAPKLFVDQAVYTTTWGESAGISELPMNNSLYQACISACCAPSFLNLQPYRFILDNYRILMVVLPDEQTSKEDMHLNVGIAMLNFAGAMENHHDAKVGWVLGAPEEKYDIPENAYIAGYYTIEAK